MVKPVMIEILGAQSYEQDDDSIEFVTQGEMHIQGNVYRITYLESEVTGMQGCTTTLTVEDDTRVSMERTGALNSSLIFERGKKHLSLYQTEVEEFMIGVCTDTLDIQLNESGGSVHITYSIEINNALASQNQITITIKEDL